MADAQNTAGNVLSGMRSEYADARQQVYFIDASLPDYQQLMMGLPEGSKAFVLEANSDPFLQMDAALRSLTDPTAAVHIYSHGREGAVQLGGQWVDEAKLDSSADILARIGESLTDSADILLYGCNTGATAAGEAFMRRLSARTSADVAASDDLTGRGGDWDLEHAVGSVETKPQQPDWSGVLGPDVSGWGVVEGTTAGEVIKGFATNDRIYSNGGADTLEGGDGNDAYYISGDSTSGTVIKELNGEGRDTVFVRVGDFDLSKSDPKADVEYIVLEAQKDMVGQSATGNDVSNTILGNALDNVLVGRGGSDFLNGDAGNDLLDGGSGKRENLVNGTDYNIIERNTLAGGKGDDDYIVRSVFDQVVENANEGSDHVFSYVNHMLANNVENLTLLDGESGKQETWAVYGAGNALNNVLRGNSIANSLSGGAGNDTLIGARVSDAAGDTLDGGAGNDVYYTYSNKDTIIDSAGRDSVYATMDSLGGYQLTDGVEDLFLTTGKWATGNAVGNRIVGNDSGNTLDGGAGADTLEGGMGNDLFIMDNASESIMDTGGRDTVRSTATVDANRFVRGDSTVEVVELSGTANINATGNTNFSTTLVGNAGNNRLNGGNMDDVLSDGPWKDSVSTSDHGTLGGLDTLAGGRGNDLYYVNNSTTRVEEAVNAGDDTIMASVDYTLAANVEHLTLQGAAKLGTGNNLANSIDASGQTTGVVLRGMLNSAGQAADTFKGGSGDDQILSYNAYDVVNGGAGTNVLYVYYKVDEYEKASAADKLTFDWQAYFTKVGAKISSINEVVYVGTPTGTATSPGVKLQGSANATYLLGTDRSDTILANGAVGRAPLGTSTTLDGGAGADFMSGAGGDDVIMVDNLNDTAFGGAGTDTVASMVNVDLTNGKFSGIEVVELQGTAGLTVRGNATEKTTLLGNAGNNQLVGGTADDYLDGGLGADVMTGGTGNDIYYIDNAGDRVVEKIGEGMDSIFTDGVHINLGGGNHANVEYVKALGEKGVSLTGTAATGESLLGGAGNDTIDGKSISDSIDGGAGDDLVYYYGQMGTLSGGAGQDTLMVRASSGTVSIGGNVTDFEVVQLENATVSTTVDASQSADAVRVIMNNRDDNVYVGSAGKDTLDFGVASDNMIIDDSGVYRRVGATNVRINASNFEVFSGGAGNDIINASTATRNLTLTGGAGSDVITGGAGDDRTIADGGNDTITLGAGRDALVITEEAMGSTITVTDFNVNMDSFDATALEEAGWKRTTAQTGLNTTVTYRRDDGKVITVILQNVLEKELSFTSAVVVGSSNTFTASALDIDKPWIVQANDSGNTITGGNRGDSIYGGKGVDSLVGGAGDDAIYGGKGDQLLGGVGNDTLRVTESANTSSDGGVGNDVIDVQTLSAGAATIQGGEGEDSIRLGTVENGTGSISIDGGTGQDTLAFTMATTAILGAAGQVTLSSGGNTLSGITITNVETFTGSREADSIDASNMSAGLTYYTNGGGDTVLGSQQDDVFYVGGTKIGEAVSIQGNGGNDQFYIAKAGVGSYDLAGGAGKDTFTVGSLDRNSAITMDGGSSGDEMDYTRFETGQNVTVRLDSTGKTASVSADGALLDKVVISNMEGFSGGSGNDALDASQMTSAGGSSALHLSGGMGNDTLRVGTIDAPQYDVHLQGGSGNDLIEVGALIGSGMGKVTLDGGSETGAGGAGMDTLYLNGSDGQKFSFSNDGSLSLSYYTAGGNPASTTPVSNVSISGFEHYKGNNIANNFDASGWNVASGSLGLEGGKGSDTFTLGTVAGGSVSLLGGAGSDSFDLGDVSGGKVFIDGGMDSAAGDILEFNGTQSVSMVLNAKGDIGSVSMGGSKVDITSSGLAAYRGTDGADILDGRAVTSIDGTVLDLQGGAGNDTLYGSNNVSNILDGSAGDDSLVGGSKNDTLRANGNDTITTGAGNDVIEFNELSAGKTITITDFNTTLDNLNDTELMAKGWNRTAERIGSSNEVIVTYSRGGQSDIKVLLKGVTNAAFLPSVIRLSDSDPNIDKDKFSSPLEIFGHAGNNTIVGGDAGNTIVGGGGNDSIHGGAGSDSIIVKGGTDSPTVTGAAGNDTLRIEGEVTGGNYYLSGASGNDSLDAGDVSGGNMTLSGAGNGDTLVGNDTLRVGSISGGNVLLTTGNGANLLVVQKITGGTLTINGEGTSATANDSIEIGDFHSSTISVNGGNGIDTLTFTGDYAVKMEFDAMGNVTMDNGTDFTLQNVEVINGTDTNVDPNYRPGGVVNPIYGDTIDIRSLGGNTTLNGMAGRDILIGNAGQSINGGRHNDTISLFNIDSGQQLVADGGADDDVLKLNSTRDVEINLRANGVNSPTFTSMRQRNDSGTLSAVGATLTNFEYFELGSGNDTVNITGTGEYGVDTGDGNDFVSIANGISVDGGILSSSVSVETGAGNDTIRVTGNIYANGAVKLVAGEGNDAVAIGDITNVSEANELAINGGAGQDTLSFIGAQSVNMVLGADGDLGYLNGSLRVGNVHRDVNIMGFEAFEGTNGADTLDVSRTATGYSLDGGKGNDVIIGGSGADTIMASSGNDTITLGAGKDVLTLGNELASGTIITVTDFDTAKDSLIDTNLTKNGWVASREQRGNDGYIFYKKGGATITVLMQGVTVNEVILSNTLTVNSATNSFDANDINSDVRWSITANNNANNVITGGKNGDNIWLNANSVGATVDGGADIDSLMVRGSSVKYTFTGDNELTGIAVDGTTLTGVSIKNMEGYYGTSGDDLVDASATNEISSGSKMLSYYMNGGNDTYIGGAGLDHIFLDKPLNAASRVSLQGGGDTVSAMDALFFSSDDTMQMYIDSQQKAQVSVNGNAVTGASISGFEQYSFSGGNDSLYAEQSSSHSGFAVRGGGGNDTLTIGSVTSNLSILYGDGGNDSLSVGTVQGRSQVSLDGGMGDDTLRLSEAITDAALTMDGGAGNDSVDVGHVSSTGDMLLQGGDGTDTLAFNSQTKGQLIQLGADGKVQIGYYAPDPNEPKWMPNTTFVANVAVDGFEFYKGNDLGNVMDASQYTVSGGTFGIEGGAGHDIVKLGGVNAGSVTLKGGAGGDRFYLGDVKAGAAVLVDAGTDTSPNDKLDFTGSNAVSLTLNAKGDIGSVSMGGTKVNITSNGLAQYQGTDGNDVLDARATSSVDSDSKKNLVLVGGKGNDTIYGGNISGGSMELVGGQGSDLLVGGAGKSVFFVGEEKSYAESTGDNDTIQCGSGTNILKLHPNAMGGNTEVIGFNGSRDTIDDTQLLSMGWSRESNTVGGVMTITYTDKTVADAKSVVLHFVNPTNVASMPTYTQTDATFDASGVNPTAKWQIQGSSGNNNITGGKQNDTLYGLGGEDTLRGGDGNDLLLMEGGLTSGQTSVYGEQGDDTIQVLGEIQGGIYTLSGNAGNDSIKLNGVSVGEVSIVGGTSLGNDTIQTGHVSGTAKLTVDGGMGNNVFYVDSVSGGEITLLGGGTPGDTAANTRNDTFYVGNITGGNVSINGNAGTDQLIFTGDAVSVKLGTAAAGNITVNGASAGSLLVDGIDYIEGTRGNDAIDVSAYNPLISWLSVQGGEGNDTLIGGRGHALSGGAGNDLLVMKDLSANTTIKGGEGMDTLHLAANTYLAATLGANGVIRTATSTIATTDVEALRLSDHGNVLTVDTVTKMTLDFGTGVDRICLKPTAVGSVLTINGFSDVDVLDSTALANWRRETSGDGRGGTSIKYINNANSNQYITVNLSGVPNYTLPMENVVTAGTSFTVPAEAQDKPWQITANGGSTVMGGTANDLLVNSTNTNNYTVLEGNTGDDILELNGAGGVISQGSYLLNGDAETLPAGGADTLNITANSISGGTFSLNGDGGNDKILVNASAISGGTFSIDGDDGNDTIEVAWNGKITGGTFAAGDDSAIEGGKGDDVISIGRVSGSAKVIIAGQEGNDTYNLQASGCKLTVMDYAGSGDSDSVQFFGISELGGTIPSDINTWDGLQFRFDSAKGDLQVRLGTKDNSNVLTFNSSAGMDKFAGDTMSFFAEQNTGTKLFGGDVDLAGTYQFISTHASDFSDWKGATFTTNGSTLSATAVK